MNTLVTQALGMKSENNRNFEAGILTDDSTIVEQAMDQFGSVWNGSMCKKCNENNIALIQSRRFDYSKHSSSKRNNGMILYRIIIFCACAHGWHSLSLTLYQI